MSYARFGSDSDVYVFSDVRGGFTCCACRLVPSDRPENVIGFDDFNCATRAEMLAHLYTHMERGHDVPDGVRDRLLAEMLDVGETP